MNDHLLPIRFMLLLAFATIVSASPKAVAADDELDFVPLFNGRDLSGWRPVPSNRNHWTVGPDKVIVNRWSKQKPSCDLISEKTFWNFTLRFDFMVPEGGNSGIYLRGRHEIQLTGDYAARKVSAVSNGAIYNQVSPAVYASKPSGEWQTIEATIVDNNVTVLLNGKIIHDSVPCLKATGGAIDQDVNAPGPIMFQGRLGDIKLRNVRIKELPR